MAAIKVSGMVVNERRCTRKCVSRLIVKIGKGRREYVCIDREEFGGQRQL